MKTFLVTIDDARETRWRLSDATLCNELQAAGYKIAKVMTSGPIPKVRVEPCEPPRIFPIEYAYKVNGKTATGWAYIEAETERAALAMFAEAFPNVTSCRVVPPREAREAA